MLRQLNGLKELLIRGLAEGQTKYGICFYKGQGVAQSDAKAVEWWQKAAEQDYAEAQGLLGYAYFKR